MAARATDIDELIERYADGYVPKGTEAERLNALPPRLGPELVDYATDAQERALQLHRDAEELEAEAELCFDAIRALQNGT